MWPVHVEAAVLAEMLVSMYKTACCYTHKVVSKSLTIMKTSSLKKSSLIYFLHLTHSPPSYAKVMNKWSYRAIPLYAIMAWTGIALPSHEYLPHDVKLFRCIIQCEDDDGIVDSIDLQGIG